MQVGPQSIEGEAGEVEATLPEPVPVFDTPRANVPGSANAAVTVCARFMVTVHVPVPVQGPLHPAKNEPAEGAGASVTMVPAA